MKNHTKIYMDFFGYTIADFMPCEICEARVVDVHHINCKGMGGDPKGKKDVIENLQGLCRSCHEFYGDMKQYNGLLLKIHLKFMEANGITKK